MNELMNGLFKIPESRRILVLMFPVISLYITFGLAWLHTSLMARVSEENKGLRLSTLWFRSARELCLIAINVDVLALLLAPSLTFQNQPPPFLITSPIPLPKQSL